jgi:glucuronokinase
MIAIVLCAAVDTELEREINEQFQLNPLDSELAKLHGLPKSLIPIAGKSMLDRWWSKIKNERAISQVYLCVNGAKCRHFERWCSERGIPHECIVNDGVTSREDSIGSAADLVMALRRARSHGHEEKDVMVLAGDHLFFKTFDLEGAVNFYASNKARTPNASALLYYTLKEDEDPSQRGMVVVHPLTKAIENFIEKPTLEQQVELFGGSGETKKNSGNNHNSNINNNTIQTKQRLGSPMFYIFSSSTVCRIIHLINTYTENSNNKALSCGKLVEMLIQDAKTRNGDKDAITTAETTFYGMRLPSAFGIMNCDSKLAKFRDFERIFSSSNMSTGEETSFDSITSVTVRSYARTGLMGNPSDGMYGKTLGITVSNFWAEVHISQSDRIILHPHPLYDPSEFGSLSDLYKVCKKEGYMGGMRLLQATLKKFAEYCTLHGIALSQRNFEVRYDTNIPKQVGLAGSSAIVSALFKGLMKFYGLTSMDIPLESQPSFVLSVEEELGINAGLQDRVMQIYEGCVHMDFNKDTLLTRNHGIYTRLSDNEEIRENLKQMPFFIAYEARPSDSGKIHSSVKARFLNNDETVLNSVEQWKKLTDDARICIETNNIQKLKLLMDSNFNLRLQLYGKDVVGESNLRMIQIARNLGCSAKFPGSGGAIVGLANDRKDFIKLRMAYEKEDFVFVPLRPYFPSVEKDK